MIVRQIAGVDLRLGKRVAHAQRRSQKLQGSVNGNRIQRVGQLGSRLFCVGSLQGRLANRIGCRAFIHGYACVSRYSWSRITRLGQDYIAGRPGRIVVDTEDRATYREGVAVIQGRTTVLEGAADRRTGAGAINNPVHFLAAHGRNGVQCDNQVRIVQGDRATVTGDAQLIVSSSWYSTVDLDCKRIPLSKGQIAVDTEDPRRLTWADLPHQDHLRSRNIHVCMIVNRTAGNRDRIEERDRVEVHSASAI